MNKQEIATKIFSVYIIECSDKTLYTGYTTNIEKRLKEHNFSIRGAKFTRSRRPVKLMRIENFDTKQQAMIREWEIKQLSHANKLRLISQTKLTLN